MAPGDRLPDNPYRAPKIEEPTSEKPDIRASCATACVVMAVLALACACCGALGYLIESDTLPR